MRLQKIRFENGLWEGRLETSAQETAPELKVMHLDQPLDGVEIQPVGDGGTNWTVTFPIPVSTLNEGLQSFLICEAASEEKLGDFTLIAGDLLAEDPRAELELLRAELDMLKRAFRRHCVETA